MHLYSFEWALCKACTVGCVCLVGRSGVFVMLSTFLICHEGKTPSKPSKPTKKKQKNNQCHNVTFHSDSAFSAVAVSQVWRGEHTRARTDLTAEKTKKLLWELRTDLKGSRYREIRSKRQWQRHLICSPTRAATSLVPSGCRTQDASNRFKPLHR